MAPLNHHTKDLTLRSKFWSVSLYDQRFPRSCTFYHSPCIDYHVKSQKKKKTKKKIATNAKFEISQFVIQLSYRPFLGVCMNFLEQICCACALSDKMSFKVFSPISSHINKNVKKLAKILKFRQSLYNFGRDPS